MSGPILTAAEVEAEMGRWGITLPSAGGQRPEVVIDRATWAITPGPTLTVYHDFGDGRGAVEVLRLPFTPDQAIAAGVDLIREAQRARK